MKQHRSIRRNRQTGAALISALALSAMCALYMCGVCLLATSYSVRQSRESDYALAIQLAEAGTDYELNYVSNHLTSTPAGHLSGAPFTGTVPGVVGTFTVYVTNTDGTTNWAPPANMKVVSTGSIGGITRAITTIGQASGGAGTALFNNAFAVFGYQSILFTQASNVINGNMGVNGPPPGSVAYSISTQSNGVGNATSSSTYPIVLAGGATLVPGNSVTPNYTNNPTSINSLPNVIAMPTVDTIAAATFANGWSTLSSSASINAQWARMRTFNTQSRSMTPGGTMAIAFTAGSTTLDDSVVKTKGTDSQWVNTLILPPGDYYFTSLSLNSSNGYSGPSPNIYFDTAALSTGGTPGPVRLWIGGTATTNDTLNMSLLYTSSVAGANSQLSRIYYDKPANFTITGNNDFAGVYAVRKGPSASMTPATVTLTQNTKITGAVIADDIVMTGGANVTMPTTSMSAPGDYSLPGSGGSYGFSGSWTEIAATGGAVFVDGTNR